MICFGCGDMYDPALRESVVDLIAAPGDPKQEGEIIHLKKVCMGGATLKLCPACTRACAIGVVLNSGNLHLAEDIEFEEDEQNADVSEEKPEDEIQ